jgi:anti-sigma B factor antagonist
VHANASVSRFEQAGAMVIAVRGEFQISTLDAIRAATDDALTLRRPMVLDLSGCTFIDSSALRLVLHLQRALDDDDLGSTLAVAIGESPVRRMLSLTAIDRSVRVIASLEDAVSAVAIRGAPTPSLSPEALS